MRTTLTIYFPKDWHYIKRDKESQKWQDFAIKHKMHFGWSFYYDLVITLQSY